VESDAMPRPWWAPECGPEPYREDLGRQPFNLQQKTGPARVLDMAGELGYPISTGPLEGTNNKIKTMKRQDYGFRDKEFFKLKIMAIHLTKYALVG